MTGATQAMAGHELRLRLCDLPVGGVGIVDEILVGGAVRRRLLDLGLVPGTRVQAVRHSPIGDPVAFRIRGAIIALRREESARILVRPANGE